MRLVLAGLILLIMDEWFSEETLFLRFGMPRQPSES